MPVGFGFPGQVRLHRPAEFQAVFARRKVVRGHWFHVHLLPQAQRPGARLGLVVPKKLLRTAVARNLAKRLVREGFRRHRMNLPDADVVFRLAARPGDSSRRFDRDLLRGEIERLLAQLSGPSGERR